MSRLYFCTNILPTAIGASLIEERNIEKADEQYEKTQLELVKNFLRSQNCAQLTITKRPQKMQQEKPVIRRPQRERWNSRPRPHSMAGIPTASEADFTKLLSGLMDQETNDADTNQKHSEDDSSVLETQNARLVFLSNAKAARHMCHVIY